MLFRSTFRHEMYKEYKGTRKPMPQELHEQVPVLKEVLTAMGIKTVEKAGYEADDILGTIAKRSEKEGMEVSLVSGDRDLLQIASDRIKIRIPKTKGGKTEIEDYYAADVEKAYQVTPVQFIELKALMGDTADNIPGVPKVGEKTATELMTTYGSIEEIYAHLDEISKKSIRESLTNNRALADLSKRLATIEIHADIDFSYEDAKLGVLFTPEAYEIFKRLAFKNMLSRFEHQGAGQQKQIEKEPKITEIRTKQELEEVVGEALKCGSAAIRFIDIDEQNEGALSENKNGQMVWQFGGSKGHFGCLLYSKAAEETVFFVENENELTKIGRAHV